MSSFKNRLYVLEQCQVDRKTEQNTQRFPIFPPPPLMLSSPMTNIPQQRGTFVTNKPASTLHYHPKFTRRFTLGVLHFMGLDKCLIISIHYVIIQNSFTSPKSSVSCLFTPPYPNPRKLLLILLST